MIIDTNSSCIGKTNLLLSKGVTAVGRYYRIVHPEYAITKPEAQELSAANIKIFVVFENTGHNLQLTDAQGRTDGKEALKQAHQIGQPVGGVIYFATEGLPDGYKTSDLPNIRTYFGGVKTAIGAKYKLGVYADGIVCKTLLKEHICTHTWLAAASTSFEGTVDFYNSKLWNLAQVKIDRPKDEWDGLSVDLNESNGDIGSFLVPVSQVA
jgi:hypothetical protein